MDFSLDDDQRLLQDTVQRLVAKDYRFEQRRAYAAEPEGFSRALWAQAADIGLLGLAYPEADGGSGRGAVDVMLVMQALGRALPLDPFLPTMVLGAAALRHADAAQRTRRIAAVAAGDCVLAWAGYGCRARPQGGGWRLDGSADAVLHGDSADALLVAARVEAGSDALFIVDARSVGITRAAWRTHDGRRAADIGFDGVVVPDDARLGASEVVDAVRQAGIAALAAEAVGAMELALELTVEHLKTRVQFGAPLARQQALQHRVAEMLINLEQTRSMAMYAALMLDEPDAAGRATALSAVKVQVGRAARFVGQQAVQLHGGIGVTDECAVGHVLKRLTLLEAEFGGSDQHLAAVARAGGFVEAA
ncbi:acyl-CoA dehydrogenase family protein [Aquincola sp. S2]|uniref:Acyl-CoA dehydrogenase family protein n=1 Tax=Pseudaquabacterium terrae TaxID=2732868 RepID=A0ABX2ETC7_9BURK|nr:acyl-CoA dehydrogenase family protein [Aquabacterium terrae]NRF72002.1 acyl-CoA dehydrogenase family protein [Aquabacterium terrae]